MSNGRGRRRLGILDAAIDGGIHQIGGDDIKHRGIIGFGLAIKEGRADNQNEQEQQVDACYADDAFFFQSVHLSGSVRIEIRVIPRRWRPPKSWASRSQRLSLSART